MAGRGSGTEINKGLYDSLMPDNHENTNIYMPAFD